MSAEPAARPWTAGTTTVHGRVPNRLSGERPGFVQGGHEDAADRLQGEGVVVGLRVEAAQRGDRDDDAFGDVREQRGYPPKGVAVPCRAAPRPPGRAKAGTLPVGCPGGPRSWARPGGTPAARPSALQALRRTAPAPRPADPSRLPPTAPPGAAPTGVRLPSPSTSHCCPPAPPWLPICLASHPKTSHQVHQFLFSASACHLLRPRGEDERISPAAPASLRRQQPMLAGRVAC